MFGDSVTFEILVMMAICLVVSAIGFYRLVYFISLGYGFSMAAMGFAAFGLFGFDSLILGFHTLLMTVYGIRLGMFLLARERVKTYKEEMTAIHAENKGKSFARKIIIWLGVSVLYVLMFLPIVVHGMLRDASYVDGRHPIVIIGLLLMCSGLAIEGVADKQKSSFKKKHGHTFCNVGLYKIVRCPNYFGEVMFWTGNGLMAFLFLGQIVWFIGAMVGYVCIVLVMIGSTRRLEFKQDARYGDDEIYQAYCAQTPILIPFVPVYSFKHLKIYLG